MVRPQSMPRLRRMVRVAQPYRGSFVLRTVSAMGQHPDAIPLAWE